MDTDRGDETLTPYQSIDRYFDHTLGSERSRVRIMRSSSIVVVGAGLVGAAAAHALIELGAGFLDIDAAQRHRDRVQLYASDARSRGKTTQCTFVDTTAVQNRTATLAAYDAAILAVDEYDATVSNALGLMCHEAGIPFVGGGRFSSWGIVAPAVLGGPPPCLACAWEQTAMALGLSRVETATGAPIPPAAAALLGNELALEAFKAVTGISETRPRQRTFVLELLTLSVSLFMHEPLACRTSAHRVAKATEDVI